jgi:hypothetical protein
MATALPGTVEPIWDHFGDERWLLMMNLLRSVKQLALWKQLIIGFMILLILLTWLAVCLVLASYLVL